eukprot:TRINITY_DN85823_c0_g1_i1.p1 TRINITY_DN85823_c0_g1~~TRINITY_DN85823_c0_g1_i1.p1  ORF type:complete len:449 (-),score=93.84 TRINITY_DN85823_c0_g1_i1:174-1520(-)
MDHFAVSLQYARYGVAEEHRGNLDSAKQCYIKATTGLLQCAKYPKYQHLAPQIRQRAGLYMDRIEVINKRLAPSTPSTAPSPSNSTHWRQQQYAATSSPTTPNSTQQTRNVATQPQQQTQQPYPTQTTQQHQQAQYHAQQQAEARRVAEQRKRMEAEIQQLETALREKQEREKREKEEAERRQQEEKKRQADKDEEKQIKMQAQEQIIAQLADKIAQLETQVQANTSFEKAQKDAEILALNNRIKELEENSTPTTQTPSSTQQSSNTKESTDSWAEVEPTSPITPKSGGLFSKFKKDKKPKQADKQPQPTSKSKPKAEPEQQQPLTTQTQPQQTSFSEQQEDAMVQDQPPQRSLQQELDIMEAEFNWQPINMECSLQELKRQEIMEIEGDLRELYIASEELNLIVHEQTKEVKTIRDYVEDSNECVKQGTGEIKEARKLQQKSDCVVM